MRGAPRCARRVPWQSDRDKGGRSRPPRRPVTPTEIAVAGDLGVLAGLRDRTRHRRVAVAVDHEPRIGLHDQRRVQGRRQPAPDLGNADIPGDVAEGIRFGEAELAKPPWERPAAMIARQKKGRCAGLVGQNGWAGLVRIEKFNIHRRHSINLGVMGAEFGVGEVGDFFRLDPLEAQISVEMGGAEPMQRSLARGEMVERCLQRRWQ